MSLADIQARLARQADTMERTGRGGAVSAPDADTDHPPETAASEADIVNSDATQGSDCAKTGEVDQVVEEEAAAPEAAAQPRTYEYSWKSPASIPSESRFAPLPNGLTGSCPAKTLRGRRTLPTRRPPRTVPAIRRGLSKRRSRRPRRPRPLPASHRSSRSRPAAPWPILFGQLKEAFISSRQRNFDEMAEEMIRPMLQDWLDNNLPTLVERLVREEIERIAQGD